MIYVLPGMGADSSMYRGEWRSLEDCVFLDWPRYRGEQTLGEIADRMIRESGLGEGSVVVGHSLGGMIACEMARTRRLRSLILISSAKRHEEVGRLATLLHHLAPITPLGFAQKAAAWLASDTARMFSRSDPEFIRATSRAIFEWPGFDVVDVPVLRIHGTQDRVIPLPPDADLVVRGGHLIPKTHTAECVGFIRSVLGSR